ncbi:MAG: type II toxin-antitoxin system HicB family antitoxin [bacterium]|nr:type II toxin-antitoxin system HicB family antitoxin [bacterium]
MRTYTAVIEKCMDTGLYVGYVPGVPGAHSQAATLDELSANMREALELIAEEGEPQAAGQFMGTQTLATSTP